MPFAPAPPSLAGSQKSVDIVWAMDTLAEAAAAADDVAEETVCHGSNTAVCFH